MAFEMRDLAVAKAEGWKHSRDTWLHNFRANARRLIASKTEIARLRDGIDEVCMMLQDFDHTTDYTARHAAIGLLSALVSPYLYALPFKSAAKSEHAPGGVTVMSAKGESDG